MTKPPMLTAQQALDHLLSNAVTVNESEKVSTQAALGRVLAEDIKSLVDHVMKENKYEESIRDTVTNVINDMLRGTELPPPTRHFAA